MRKITYLFLLVFLVLIIGYSCSHIGQSDSEKSPYLNHQASVTYVGKEVCKGCHMDIYNTFSETGMGKSWDFATHQKSSAKFNASTLVYDTLPNLYYHPQWNGDTLQIMEFRLLGKDTIHRRIENIKYIVGSGQHTNSHIFDINGFLYQAPLTYYTQMGQWNLPPGFEGGHNSRFGRAIEPECMSCHNSLPVFDDQSLNKYNKVELGLSCERCHGPGSMHVQEKQKGNMVDIKKDIDYTIVNPAKLPWALQIDVCQRCHLQGNAVLQEGKSFADFRPGMKLSTIEDVYMPRFTGDDSKFIMASHAERLQKSACFLKSNTLDVQGSNGLKLTCITCHNPHVSVKVTGKEIFNNACIKCHQEKKCTAPPTELSKANNDCVKCHMPQNGTLDIPHVTVHDHYIRKPITQKQIEGIQKFAGISCINNSQPTAVSKAEAYLNYFEKFDSKQSLCLDSAFYFLQSCPNENALWIHYYYLIEDYTNLISFSQKLNRELLRDSWTSYRVGEAYMKQGKYAEAESWIDQTVSLKPKQLAFLLKQGNVKYHLGKIVEAQKIFEQILYLNPKYPEAWNSLGLIICNKGQGDLNKALSYYQRALQLDPDMENALINCLDIYNAQGNRKEFLLCLKRLYKIAPKNPVLLPMYSQFQIK